MVAKLGKSGACLSGCLSKLKSLGMKMNAETQRNAEKRRENEASADLCTAIVEIARRLRGNPMEYLLTEK
jgi:hypothetical protein